jgi:hypothetical protein
MFRKVVFGVLALVVIGALVVSVQAAPPVGGGHGHENVRKSSSGAELARAFSHIRELERELAQARARIRDLANGLGKAKVNAAELTQARSRIKELEAQLAKAKAATSRERHGTGPGRRPHRGSELVTNMMSKMDDAAMSVAKNVGGGGSGGSSGGSGSSSGGSGSSGSGSGSGGSSGSGGGGSGNGGGDGVGGGDGTTELRKDYGGEGDGAGSGAGGDEHGGTSSGKESDPPPSGTDDHG